jgi:hypothetical protein
MHERQWDLPWEALGLMLLLVLALALALVDYGSGRPGPARRGAAQLSLQQGSESQARTRR